MHAPSRGRWALPRPPGLLELLPSFTVRASAGTGGAPIRMGSDKFSGLSHPSYSRPAEEIGGGVVVEGHPECSAAAGGSVQAVSCTVSYP